jgi:hypothetical protein
MKVKEVKSKKKDKNGIKIKGNKVAKKKDKKVDKLKAEVIKLEVAQNDPKSQLQQLGKFLKCDHVISFSFGDLMKKSEAKQKFEFLVSML